MTPPRWSWSSRLLSGSALLVLALIVEAPGGGTEVRAEAAPRDLTGASPGEPDASCPLSLPEQEKAIKAFQKMIPVFRHPRCQNCHGGVDPTVGTHGGVEITVEDTRKNVCSECHADPNWGPPSDPSRLWSKRSDEWICRRIRDDNAGEFFLQHLREDDLITLGFEGNRNLNDGARTIYTETTGRPFRSEPPPVSHRQFWEQGIEWLKAMGGDFVGTNECGCVRGKVELRMTSDWSGTGMGTTLASRVTATVPLVADTTGLVFSGQAPLVHGSYTMRPVPGGCTVNMKPEGGELKVTEARLEQGSGKEVTIVLSVVPSTSGGVMQMLCPGVPVPPLPLMPWSGEWQYLHRPEVSGEAYRFDRFDMAPGEVFGSEPRLIGRKEVTRTGVQDELTVTTKTRFELWWLGLKPTT